MADDSRDLILAGVAELDEHEKDVRQADDYFRGTVREFFASPRLERALRRTGSTFRVNVAKKAVTAVTDRLEVAAVSVPNNPTAERTLRQILDDNEFFLEFPVIMRKACTYGDAYLFLWQEDDGRITVNYSGPMTTRAIYDEENPQRIAYVVKRWMIGPKNKRRARVNLYFFGSDGSGASEQEDGRIEKWITEDGTTGSTAEHWTEYIEEDEPWPLPNPHGQIVFHLRTDRPYGVPLHVDAYGPQDAITKLSIVLMNTIDYQGAPQRYALLEGATESEDADSDFDDFEPDGLSPTFDPNAIPRDSAPSKLATGPGEMMLLKNVKTAGQFDPASSDAFLKPADWYVRMMAVASDTPLHLYDPSGDQPSGESRRSADGTLTKKIDWLTLSFSAELAKLCRAVLKMAGVTVPRVDVRFTPSEQVDDLDFWQTMKAKLDAGVPVRQVLLEGGYTDIQVDEWITSTDEENLTRRVALMASIAGVLKDLGTAVQLTLITPEQANEIIASLMPVNDERTSEDA